MEPDQLPPVRAIIRDPRNGVTYEVCAYREITRDEAVAEIQRFNAPRKVAHARGSTVTIITTIR